CKGQYRRSGHGLVTQSTSAPQVLQEQIIQSNNVPQVKQVQDSRSQYVPQVLQEQIIQSNNVPQVKQVQDSRSEYVTQVQREQIIQSNIVSQVQQVQDSRSEYVPQLQQDEDTPIKRKEDVLFMDQDMGFQNMGSIFSMLNETEENSNLHIDGVKVPEGEDASMFGLGAPSSCARFNSKNAQIIRNFKEKKQGKRNVNILYRCACDTSCREINCKRGGQRVYL
ncbi:unnamed protein product, partial [Owenia fusiformis]